MHQGQMVDAVTRPDCANDYPYGRDQSPPTSYTLQQPMLPIVTDAQLHGDGYHGSP